MKYQATIHFTDGTTEVYHDIMRWETTHVGYQFEGATNTLAFPAHTVKSLEVRRV